MWLIPAAIGSLQLAATYAMRGALSREWLSVVMQIPRWLAWAPLTPLIFAAVRRYPLVQGRLIRSLLVHVGLALVCVGFIEVVSTIPLVKIDEMRTMGAGETRPSLLFITFSASVARLLTHFITYAAVVAVASTLDYQRRLRERELRAVQLESDLAQAQVQAIKMQVQPHFLFNTLHAINVLIHQEPATASRMVTQLGDLLRHTLTRATVTEVPLRSELEILTLYFEIERVRFRDRLAVTFDVAPDTLDALVPDLVLQPLAENAIKHGIAQMMEPGTVVVRARRAGDRLVLEIQDSGVGPLMAERSHERIGLTTVRARLERLYGERHALSLEPGDHGGCVARATMPFREGVAHG